jgi:hypothetical protein
MKANVSKSRRCAKPIANNYAHLSLRRTGGVGQSASALNPQSAIPNPHSPCRRISPHLDAVLHYPRGEIQTISPHPSSPTGEPQTTCANALARNSPSFAPPEKRKKFRWCKTHEPIPQTTRAQPIVEHNPSHYTKVRKTVWGEFCAPSRSRALHVAECLRHSDGNASFGETRLRDTSDC